MRKLFYTLPAAALLMASCSDDIPGNDNFGDGNVNYKISVPASFGTRAYGDGEFGDGTTARNLQYAVYDIDGDLNTLIQTGTAVFNNVEDNYKNTTVSLNLAKGRSYNIVFFAQEGNGATGSLYEFEALENGATVKVDYTKADANSDQADCFYQLEATGVVSAPINKTITLRRPVAQINWGTDDAKEPVVTHATVYDKDNNGEIKNYWSKMTTKAYNTFDLLAGDVVATSEVDVTFDYAPRPATTYTFPVAKEDAAAEPYKYLRMAYLFVPKAQQLIDVTLEHSQNGTSTLASVNVTGAPVQANYRTNIFGSLLTSPANYKVTKDEMFLGDYQVAMWDGVSVENPVYNTVTNNYEIQNPAQLAGFAALVNDNIDTYEGKTFVLTEDVDMGGNEWKPIGMALRTGDNYNGTAFKGTFDGNGKTIKNLLISNDELYAETRATVKDDCAAGLFGVVDGGTVKDITINNLQIDLPENELAGVVGMLTNGGTVENVTVVSGSVNVKNGAAIVGRLMHSGTVKGCHNGADVKGSKANLGGIVGTCYYASGDCFIIDCSNSGNITSTVSVAGGIVGYSLAKVENCSNTGTVKATTSVGGIAGNVKGYGYVKNCVNDGNVIATAVGDETGAGGIVGTIDLWGSVSAPLSKELVEISGNTNKVNLDCTGAVAGIVGAVGHGAIVKNNVNLSSSIKGTTYGSAIVGVHRCYSHGNNVPYKMEISGNRVVMATITAPKNNIFINWHATTGRPSYTETNNTVEVNSPAALVAVSNAVNAGTRFEGSTVVVTEDIDMSGVAYTPMAPDINAYSTIAFAGTFDGNNKTISNLTASSSTPDNAAAGLFGALIGNVKNVILKNVNITSTHWAGGIAGYVDNETGALISNCKVIGGTITSKTEMLNGKWDNGDKVGGILGYGCVNTDKVTGCSVENLTLKGYRHMGSIVGFASNLNNVSGNSAKNITIVHDGTNNYKNFSATNPVPMGLICGNNGTNLGDNTAENVSLPTPY